MPGGPLKSFVDIIRLPVKVLFVNNVLENNDILFTGIYKLLYYFGGNIDEVSGET